MCIVFKISYFCINKCQILWCLWDLAVPCPSYGETKVHSMIAANWRQKRGWKFIQGRYLWKRMFLCSCLQCWSFLMHRTMCTTSWNSLTICCLNLLISFGFNCTSRCRKFLSCEGILSGYHISFWVNGVGMGLLWELRNLIAQGSILFLL